jgi:hypothetical protein
VTRERAVVVAFLGLASLSAGAAPLVPKQLLDMSCAERRAALQQATPEERADLIAKLSDDDLVALGKRALCALGTVYRVRLTKQERVRGNLLDPQTLALTVREEPFAVRMDVVDGPATGRRALYNVQLRKEELRARDAGLFGVLPMWVDIHGWLALRDTNHLIIDLGFGGFLRRFEANMPRSRAAGVVRHNVGTDSKGRYCIDFVAPPGAKDVYAAKTRVCMDTALALPASAVSTDERDQLMERNEFTQLEPDASVAADFFTVEGSKL